MYTFSGVVGFDFLFASLRSLYITFAKMYPWRLFLYMEKQLWVKVKQRGLNETKNWSQIFQQFWIEFPFVKLTISKEHGLQKSFWNFPDR